MLKNTEILSKLSECDSKEQEDKYMELLIKKNTGLIKSIAAKYMYSSLDMDDLIQEGMLGLLKAIAKYNSDSEMRFKNYAALWISQSMHRAVDNKGSLIRLPSHVREVLTKAYLLQSQRHADSLPIYTLEALAGKLNIDYFTLVEYTTMALEPVSLDSPVNDLEAATYHDIISNSNPELAMEGLSKQDLKERIALLLSLLNERDKTILIDLYGLEGKTHSASLLEISKTLNLSKSRVKQIKDKILESCTKEPKILIFKGFENKVRVNNEE